jgi:PKD repeat protein
VAGPVGSIALLLLLVISGLGFSVAAPGAVDRAAGAPIAPLAPGAALLAAAEASLAPPPAGPVSPWTNITSVLSNSPQAREGAAMAFDPNIDKVVLFGGFLGNRTGHDTWEFARGHWANVSLSIGVAPRGRQHAGFVYDSEDNEMLLFGGHDGPTYLNDTWAFNGTGWSLVNSTLSPSPREDLMMADDPADGYVVLFGGESPSGHLLNDTWTFVGGQWTNITTSLRTAPPAREDGGFTYDGADGYDLLFSGKAGTTGLWDDTWNYSAGAWHNITLLVGTEPPKRESMSLAYDAVDGYVVLFGGLHYPTALSDEWTFSGGHWTEQFPATHPSGRFDSSLAYYPNDGLGYLLLFGGQTNASAPTSVLSDTWTYKLPVTVVVHATKSLLDVGQSTELSLQVTGGYAPYTAFAWFGLPSSCPSVSATSLSCTPGTNGTYSITANATDTEGSNGTSAAFTLVVNPDPTVVASASVYAGQAPLSVSFSAQVSAGTPPYSYDWLFGDGTNSSSVAPTHVFTTAGTFDAALTITDNLTFTATSLLQAIVVSAPLPSLNATISASPMSGVAPLLVQFGVSASGGTAPYTYAWTFGVTGASSTVANPAYTYQAAGTFDAQVVVTDADEATVTRSVDITVAAPPPLAAFASGTPTTGVAPLTIAFTGTASGGATPYTFAWAFDATHSGLGASVQFTYTNAGSYTAVLTVTDALGAQKTASVPVSVLPPLNATFVAAVGSPYCSQGTGYAVITVNASATGGIGRDSFSWSFPNGVGSGANATTTVGAGATSTIQLTATDASGTSVRSTQSVSVPSVSCSTPAGGTTSGSDLLVLVLIVIVAAVVAIEAVLIVRRRKKTP